MGVQLTPEEFEELVDEALGTVPAELLDLVENCLLLIEDDPPPEYGTILGLYEGIPLTERDSGQLWTEPDRIRIFRNPLLAICSTREEVAEEIEITVVHEIAHYFGIDDDRLHDLGWG